MTDLIRREDAIRSAMNVPVFNPSAAQSEINIAVLVLAKVDAALRNLPAAPDPRDEVIRRLTAELADGSFYKESDIDRLMAERDDARADVARLREALSFYADFYETPNDGPWGVLSEDFGKVARVALTFAREQLK